MPSGIRKASSWAVLALLGAGMAFAVPARAADGVQGPKGTAEVRVVDAVTGEPVPWANVLLAGGLGLLADEAGICRIERDEEGSVGVRVVHVAYEASPEVQVPVGRGTGSPVTIRLVPYVHEMAPVEVHGRPSDDLGESTRGSRRVEVAAAAALPNPTDDPFQLVRLLPGVSAEDVGSDFRLRGGSVDETLVRLDGMEIRSLFHGRDFGGVTGIVPLGLVDRLDVYPGAFPAELGGRTSGAIDVALRDRGPEGLHGTIAADVTAARALVESTSPGGSVFASVREGYLHRILDSIQKDAVVHPAYRDLLVRGVRRLDASRTLTANYLRVEDHAFYDDGIDSHFVDADYRDHYAWTGLRWLVTRELALRATAYGAFSSQRRRLEEGTHDDRDARRLGGRLETALSRGDHLWKLGADAEYERAEFALAGGNIVRIDESGHLSDGGADEGVDLVTRRRWGAWLQDEWRPWPALALNLGLRASGDTGTERAEFAPRVAASLQLPSGFRIRGAVGRHAQSPRGELQGSSDLLVVSDRIQRADHATFGVEKVLGSLRLGAEAWQKDFHPLDGVVSRTEDGVTERHVIRGGRSRGLDTYLRRDGENANWWLAYSLGRSEWNDGGRSYTRDFDALHTLALANTYRIARNWDLGVSYRFRTGTPYTEQSWRRESDSQWILDEGELNGSRLPAYHRVDVRVRRHFRIAGHDASVWGEALNLTNHDNVLWYAWRLREPDGSARADAERVTRTGVPGIPSLGFEVRF